MVQSVHRYPSAYMEQGRSFPLIITIYRIGIFSLIAYQRFRSLLQLAELIKHVRYMLSINNQRSRSQVSLAWPGI